MRTILTIFLLFIFQIASFAQGRSDLKSNLKALSESKPDTNRILILHELGKYYLFKSGGYKTDLDSALYFFSAAVRLSNAQPLDSVKIRSFRNENLCRLGETYIQLRDTSKAKQCFMSVIADYQRIGDKSREARTWLRLGRKTWPDSNPMVMIYYWKALRLSQEIKDKKREAEIWSAIGMRHKDLNHVSAAIVELLRAASIYDSLKIYDDNHIKPLYTLGELNRYFGNYEDAMVYALKALRMRESLGNNSKSTVGSIYSLIGALHAELSQHEKSAEMFVKAVQDFEVNLSGEGDLATAVIYWQSGFLAEELIKLGLASQALEHFDGLIQRRPPKTELEMGIASQMIALCYSELDLDQAETEYKKMLDHYQKADFDPMSSNRTELLAQAYFDISKFYIKKQRFSEAIVYLKKIEHKSNGIFTLSRQRDLQMMLFKIDSVSGNFLSAIEHFRTQQSLNDSIISIAKSKQFNELQIQYETDKKENEITLLQNKSQLQESRLNLTIAGVVLLLLAITLLFGRYWMKQKSNKKLLVQQIEIKQKNIELSNLLDEKDWLVKEVHHRVKNNLQMVISLLNSQSSYLSNHDAVVAIKESQRRMHAMSLIHQRLYEKTGSTIDMQTYIVDLVNYFKDSFDCSSIQFKLDLDPVMLDVSQAVPVGLILNEAITNSLKYAFPDGRTGNILVSFKHVSPLLELTIADDGIGFAGNDNAHPKKSLGMSLQKGLATQIGGTYELQNESGTEILIRFPQAEIGKNELHNALT